MGLKSREKGAPQESHYVFMWNVTDAAATNLNNLKAAMRTASGMVRDLGGTCRLYVTTGGEYDFVGIARGITDAQASQLRLAVDGLGQVKTTTFFKLQDYTLDEFDGHVDASTKLLKAKP
jgi:uncharacterized protein with GYD domain